MEYVGGEIYASAIGKVARYLNEIGHFKLNPNEENNICIDRFKKLVGKVRSIDEKQVPTDIGLGVLKETMRDEELLWAHIHLSKNMSLDEMTEIHCEVEVQVQKKLCGSDQLLCSSGQPEESTC